MPIPKPRKDEKTSDFISRCIRTLHHRDPNRSNAQIIAICHDAARKAGRKIRKKKRRKRK